MTHAFFFLLYMSFEINEKKAIISILLPIKYGIYLPLDDLGTVVHIYFQVNNYVN